MLKLIRSAKELKKDIGSFSDASDWGKDDPALKAEDILRLLEKGSNTLREVVRHAAAVKGRIGLQRTLNKNNGA